MILAIKADFMEVVDIFIYLGTLVTSNLLVIQCSFKCSNTMFPIAFIVSFFLTVTPGCFADDAGASDVCTSVVQEDIELVAMVKALDNKRIVYQNGEVLVYPSWSSLQQFAYRALGSAALACGGSGLYTIIKEEDMQGKAYGVGMLGLASLCAYNMRKISANQEANDPIITLNDKGFKLVDQEFVPWDQVSRVECIGCEERGEYTDILLFSSTLPDIFDISAIDDDLPVGIYDIFSLIKHFFSKTHDCAQMQTSVLSNQK